MPQLADNFDPQAAMERQCWLCLAHIPTNKPSISSSSSSSTLSSMSTSSSTSSSSCASPSISSGPSYFSLDRPLIDQDSVYAQATSATASSSQVRIPKSLSQLTLFRFLRQCLAPLVEPVKKCSAARNISSFTGKISDNFLMLIKSERPRKCISIYLKVEFWRSEKQKAT